MAEVGGGLWVGGGREGGLEGRGDLKGECSIQQGGVSVRVWIFFLLHPISTSLSLAGNSGGLTRVIRQSSRKSSAIYPLLLVCAAFCVCSINGMAARVWEVLTCAQVLMHAIAHGGCTDTVRESVLEVDWEKNPLTHLRLEPA